MTLRDFFNLLFKRIWLFLLVFVAFTAALIACGMYWPKSYTAQASLYLQGKRQTISQSLPDNPTIRRDTSILLEDVLSEVQLLGSDTLRGTVVRELGLVDSDPLGEPGEDQQLIWESHLNENIEAKAQKGSNVIALTFTDSDPGRAARVVSGFAETYLQFRRNLVQQSEGADALQGEVDRSRISLEGLEQELAEFDRSWKSR